MLVAVYGSSAVSRPPSPPQLKPATPRPRSRSGAPCFSSRSPPSAGYMRPSLTILSLRRSAELALARRAVPLSPPSATLASRPQPITLPCPSRCRRHSLLSNVPRRPSRWRSSVLPAQMIRPRAAKNVCARPRRLDCGPSLSEPRLWSAGQSSLCWQAVSTTLFTRLLHCEPVGMTVERRWRDAVLEKEAWRARGAGPTASAWRTTASVGQARTRPSLGAFESADPPASQPGEASGPSVPAGQHGVRSKHREQQRLGKLL